MWHQRSRMGFHAPQKGPEAILVRSCRKLSPSNSPAWGLCRLSDLHYDEAAAAQLQAAVESERAHVQRCKDNADQLSTTLAGESTYQHELRT